MPPGEGAKMVPVPHTVETCVVCHRSHARGSRNRDEDIFICAQCGANADQLFEIQDTLWREATFGGESTDEATTPEQPWGFAPVPATAGSACAMSTYRAMF